MSTSSAAPSPDCARAIRFVSPDMVQTTFAKEGPLEIRETASLRVRGVHDRQGRGGRTKGRRPTQLVRLLPAQTAAGRLSSAAPRGPRSPRPLCLPPRRPFPKEGRASRFRPGCAIFFHRKPSERSSRYVCSNHSALHGFELVTPPAFELAEVLERGLGVLDPHDVLRFVEPESGEVAALRPDVTPQIARMAATRLDDCPGPMAPLLRGDGASQASRARTQAPADPTERRRAARDGGPEGDVELMALAASAVRSTGHVASTVDWEECHRAGAAARLFGATGLGHPRRARPQRFGLGSVELVGQTSASSEVCMRFAGCPSFTATEASGRGDPPARFDAGGAGALGAARPMGPRRAGRARIGAAGRFLGEVRGFAYYTGAIFHLLAEGPGEPIGSGGRYDDLGWFGAPMPAAGFALD